MFNVDAWPAACGSLCAIVLSIVLPLIRNSGARLSHHLHKNDRWSCRVQQEARWGIRRGSWLFPFLGHRKRRRSTRSAVLQRVSTRRAALPASRFALNLYFSPFLPSAHRLSFQVITKLLYLSNQGDSFTRVFLHSSSFPSSKRPSNPNHVLFACFACRWKPRKFSFLSQSFSSQTTAI